MTIEAPLHQKRVRLEHQRHLIDRAVARRAANALADMNTVVKVRKIAEAMDLHPLDRFAGSIALAHRLQIADVIEQSRVAVHTGFRGRDAGGSGILNGSMTIAAVNAIVAHMMFVAELHRLLAENILPRKIWRASERQDSRKRQSRQENRGKQAETGDKIRAAVKNLGHIRVALWRAPPFRGAATGRLHHQPLGAQARSVIDAIVSIKTFGNATLRKKLFLKSASFRQDGCGELFERFKKNRGPFQNELL